MVSTVQYHNTPQAPRPATVIPAHIQPSQRRAYIPYPTFLLHGGGSQSSIGHDDDLPWILISTSASEAPRISAGPKPRQARAPPAPSPQAQRQPQATGPMRYCSQTFSEHRRLSRKPMSADLHSLYSLHSDDGSTSGGNDSHRTNSFSGASRTSSGSSCYSNDDSSNYSTGTSSCYSNDSVRGSSRSRSSIDSLPSQEQRRQWSDPLQEILTSRHSPDMRGSFFARRAAITRMVSPPPPPPPPPETDIAATAVFMPTAAEISPRGILRFEPSPRRGRKRVAFKREPELEEPIALQDRGSSEWEVLDEPRWAI